MAKASEKPRNSSSRSTGRKRASKPASVSANPAPVAVANGDEDEMVGGGGSVAPAIDAETHAKYNRG